MTAPAFDTLWQRQRRLASGSAAFQAALQFCWGCQPASTPSGKIFAMMNRKIHAKI